MRDVALIPADRYESGVVVQMSVAENLVLNQLGLVSQHGVLSRRKMIERAVTLVDQFEISTPGADAPVWTLSGGNQQKAVLAKWLGRKPTLLIVDEPTRGIDVGTKAEVHRLLSELAAQGVAVLMISSELPEVLGMADRVVVLFEGRVMREFARADADEDAIMRAATGLVEDAA
jgi:rhamnose transport system ATP-binding protein